MTEMKLKVDGADVLLDESECEIKNIGAEMDKVAAQQSYWGKLWGISEGEKESIDATYRHWRAKLTKQLLEVEPKAPEWKTKAEIEANPEFISYKKAVALSIRNTIVLKTHCESFKTKASMLQSKGANMRAELEGTGMTTRRKADDAPDDRVSRMKEINKQRSKE
jgi:hypothetical protein